MSKPLRARPKILFLTRSLEMGGAERQLVELALGLHGIGWDVKVASFYGGGPFEARLREAGVEAIDLRKRGRWYVMGFLARVARLMRAERPDIVHGYLDVPNIVLTLLRPFAPQTRVVWGIRASNMTAHDYGWLARLETRVGALLSPLADLIICNSGAGRDYHIAAGFSARRMMVIPNGIDICHFRPDPDARAALRAAWHLRADEKLIGVVGRLDPMKDHVNFLTAAAAVVRNRRSHVRFVCVGDGPETYRAELLQTAGKLGLADRVIWEPARTDVWRVYNALDIAVSSSRFGEGFANTVAEAMATGVPCVVTDVGDSAAIVGESGWVCPPGDSDALARAILSALDALPVDAAAIRRRITQSFTPAELVRRSAESFSGLLQRDARAPGSGLEGGRSP